MFTKQLREMERQSNVVITKKQNMNKEQKMELFRNKVGNPYSNQFVVKEIDMKDYGWHNDPKLAADEAEYSDKLNKWGLLHLYNALINVMENNPNPKFTDVLRYTGNKTTSFGSARTTLKKLGVINYNGKTMVKGMNWDRFVNGKWDWFTLPANHKVKISK